tara:strand:- start:259 stop:528 length:270 start_codon:yes stop_codon:yes gene_type:complete
MFNLKKGENMKKINIVKHLNLDVYKIQDEVRAKGQVKICDHIIKIRKDDFGGGFATMITYDLIKPNNKSIQVFTIHEALKNITLRSERA